MKHKGKNAKLSQRIGRKFDCRAVTRTLIGGGRRGVHIHIFMFCSTTFFSNQI